MRYRKRPVTIEAVRYNGSNADRLRAFARDAVVVDPDCFWVDTKEGRMRGDLGDWLIRGVAGEFYPCKPEIFEATYDPAPSGLPDISIAYVRFFREGPDNVYRMEDATEDYDALLAFAREVMKDWPEAGELDGFDLQEIAERHGLLAPTTQAEPCAPEGCWCAGYFAPDDWPVQCYRRTNRLKGPTP